MESGLAWLQLRLDYNMSGANNRKESTITFLGCAVLVGMAIMAIAVTSLTGSGMWLVLVGIPIIILRELWRWIFGD